VSLPWVELCCFAFDGWRQHDRGAILLAEEWKYLSLQEAQDALPQGKPKSSVREWLYTYDPARQFIVIGPERLWAQLHTGTSINTPEIVYKRMQYPEDDRLIENDRIHGAFRYSHKRGRR
jgi:hypothetical protein